MLLLYIYWLTTLAMGIAAVVNGSFYAGIAGVVGPTLCCFAASGLKGSLLVGTRGQKFGGLAAGILFAATGAGLVYHSGYWVYLFGYDFTGLTWCAVGLLCAWISTKRRHAL